MGIILRLKSAWVGAMANFWQPVGGGRGGRGRSIGNGTYDVYHHELEPQSIDLIGAYEDTVYACVNLIGEHIGQTGFKVIATTEPGQNKPQSKTRKFYPYQRQMMEKDVWVGKHVRKARDVDEVVDHAILDIIDRPNPHHNFNQLLDWTVRYLELTGSAFWYKAKAHYGTTFSEVREIYLLPSQDISIEQDEKGKIKKYVLSMGNENQDLDPADVLHIKYFNAMDPYNSMGVPPTRAIWQWLQLLRKEKTSWETFLDNMAVSGPIIGPPPGEFWTPQQTNRLNKQIRDRFSYGKKNGLWVVEQPFNFQSPPAVANNNVAALSIHPIAKESILNVFRVPPAIFNQTDTNLASDETSNRLLERDCLRPRVGNLFDQISHDKDLFPARMRIIPTNILQPDSAYELQRVTNLVQGNLMQFNEGRIIQGLPPDPRMEGKYMFEVAGPTGVGTLPNLAPQKAIKSQKQYITTSLPDSTPLASVLTGVFGRLKDDALSRLKKASVVEKSFVPMADWTKEIAGAVNPVIKVYYDEGSGNFFDQMGMSLRRLPVLQLDRAVDKASLSLAESTLATTDRAVDDAVKELREQIREGLSQGEANILLRQRVEGIFTNLISERAYLIAETESSRAKHAGELMAMDEAGVKVKKVWLADAFACDKCAKLDGVSVDRDSPFMVEGTGPYAVKDHPPQHPSCRCTMQYEIMED